MNRIYLDNAATTAVDEAVVQAMIPYLTQKFGNPSSIYSFGRETRMAVESARKTVARLLGAQPAEIFFTSGGTESNNFAIQSSVRDLGCTRIITSRVEHHAVLHTIEFLEQQQQVKVEYVKLLPNGHVDLEDLERRLSAAGEKTLVSLMHGNNEIGNLLPLERVGQLCRAHGAYFHSDTVQTVGHFPMQLESLQVDFATGAAHKFHGPKGVGILYVNQRVKIHPLVFGGGQERNMRAGTENVYGIVGFSRALELATERHASDLAHITDVKSYMHEQLKARFPEVSFHGDCLGQSLYTVLNVGFPKNDKSEMLLMNMDIRHICASGGSACSSGAESVSHVIQTLMPVEDRVVVRFSFCRHNTREEVDQVIQVLSELLS